MARWHAAARGGWLRVSMEARGLRDVVPGCREPLKDQSARVSRVASKCTHPI